MLQSCMETKIHTAKSMQTRIDLECIMTFTPFSNHLATTSLAVAMVLFPLSKLIR